MIISLFSLAAPVAVHLYHRRKYKSMEEKVRVLQAQVKELQQALARTQEAIKEQNRQIREAKLRLNLYKGLYEAERMKNEGQIRGAIMQQCAFKEYFVLRAKELRSVKQGEELTGEEESFLKIFEAVISKSANLTKEDFATLKAYIEPRYSAYLRNLRSPDFAAVEGQYDQLSN
jgi:regulator of protease activity HflC (stomatin/prohibitin superfamily)